MVGVAMYVAIGVCIGEGIVAVGATGAVRPLEPEVEREIQRVPHALAAVIGLFWPLICFALLGALLESLGVLLRRCGTASFGFTVECMVAIMQLLSGGG